MSRPALRTLHAAGSTVGLVIITAFFVSTIVAEIGGDPGTIIRVKTGIFYALFALVPIMAVAGATGRRLAGMSQAPVVQRKMRRMRLVGINAVVVLIPCVVALYWLASHGSFGWEFAAVQAAELAAGAANIVLLGLNLRDGLRMRGARARGGRAPRAGRPVRAQDPSPSRAR